MARSAEREGEGEGEGERVGTLHLLPSDPITLTLVLRTSTSPAQRERFPSRG